MWTSKDIRGVRKKQLLYLCASPSGGLKSSEAVKEQLIGGTCEIRLNLVAIFALLHCFFFLLYFLNIWYWLVTIIFILFLRDYIYFVCRLCVRLLRRVKTLLPWILFKVCLPFRWEKCKVCENFRRTKRFKFGSNSFIFQKMVRCSLSHLVQLYAGFSLLLKGW